MTGDDYQYTPADVADLRARMGILEALAAAQDRWPDVSKLAYEAESVQHLVDQIAALLDVTEEAAISVGEMQVQRLSQAEQSKLRDQLSDLNAELTRALKQLGE